MEVLKNQVITGKFPELQHISVTTVQAACESSPIIFVDNKQ